MSWTRRRLARSLFAAPASLALYAPVRAWSQTFKDQGPLPPNVFISPCGQPFRAKPGAPYPVVDWFKQVDVNADGKIDHAEFTADAEAFFKKLDLNGDGAISPYEVAYYEIKVAPEVLGGRVDVDDTPEGRRRALLWLVQGMPGGGMGGGGMGGSMGGGGMGTVDPGGGQPNAPAPKQGLDESGAGASPYSFFDEPEPVAAADTSFRGIIRKADFLRLSDLHFKTLDADGKGYLTLAGLPETPVQRRLTPKRRRGR